MTDLVRAPARLYRAVDGDSFDLLINFRRHPRWIGAQIVDCRLRDYSARELRDVADEDPFGLSRAPGPDARALAIGILYAVDDVLEAEIKRGEGTFGRTLVWLWRGDDSVGQMLAARGVVAPRHAQG